MGELVLFAAFLIGVALTPTSAQDDAAPVDFHKHIEPILRVRCHECHGPNKQKGHLRLDSRAAALKGGDSGIAIVGVGPDRSILLEKIESVEPNDRMPPVDAGDPLSAAQIARLKQWVEAGAPWPDPPDAPSGWVAAIVEFWSITLAPYAIYVGVWLIFIAGFAVTRRLARRRLEIVIAQGCEPSRPLRQLAGLGSGARLTVLAIVVFIALFMDNQNLRARIQTLEATSTDNVIRETSAFGFPPVPQRIESASALARVYYRGNCERDEKLYNGGNYRTATIRLDIVNADVETLNTGNSLDGKMVGIRVRIERAPHTPDSLFSDTIISRLLMSRQLPERAMPANADRPVRFETTEPGQRWQAVYPVEHDPQGDPASNLTGVIYIYHNSEIQGERIVSGVRHYAIKYELVVDQGRIVEGSDVFMQALFWTPAIEAPTQSDRLPFVEWFSTKPIPKIVGGNSDDPKLLGIDEHVKDRD